MDMSLHGKGKKNRKPASPPEELEEIPKGSVN